MKLNLNLKGIKIQKDFYKNPKFLIGVGAVLVIFGGLSYITKPKQTYRENGEVQLETLTVEQAKTLIESLVKNAIDVYESPAALFKVSDAKLDVVEESNEEKEAEEAKEEKEAETADTNAKLISNYNDIIKTIFSPKGIKQLEKMTFNSKKYVQKNNDVVYFMNGIIDEEYKLTDVAFTYSNLTRKKDVISCNLNFNKVTIDEFNTVNYYIITKPIKIIKDGETWLIDNFDYTSG